MRIAKNRRGVAMILVVGQLACMFSFWALANRQVGNLLTLLATLDERDRADQGSVAALGVALDLLETGTPPEADRTSAGPDLWEYGYPRTSPAYLVRFTKSDDAGETWNVRAWPSNAATRTLPTSFAPESGDTP